MSMRLAMHVSMCIYTYEKVSSHRANKHKIYAYVSNIRSTPMHRVTYVLMYIYMYEKVSSHRASEHNIYVGAPSYVCVYVHLYI